MWIKNGGASPPNAQTAKLVCPPWPWPEESNGSPQQLQPARRHPLPPPCRLFSPTDSTYYCTPRKAGRPRRVRVTALCLALSCVCQLLATVTTAACAGHPPLAAARPVSRQRDSSLQYSLPPAPCSAPLGWSKRGQRSGPGLEVEAATAKGNEWRPEPRSGRGILDLFFLDVTTDARGRAPPPLLWPDLRTPRRSRAAELRIPRAVRRSVRPQQSRRRRNH